MLCGTPVVAYARGARCRSSSTTGVTGVLATTSARRSAAVARAAGFDRAACREAAVRRFSADRMVDDYLAVYETVLA